MEFPNNTNSSNNETETETEINYDDVDQTGGSESEHDTDNEVEDDVEDPKVIENEVDDEVNDEVYDVNFDETENIFIKESDNASAFVDDSDRITISRLTQYERVRLLGDRAKQLSEGAKPLIKCDKIYSAMEIAILELEKKVIPLKIIRPRPDGKQELWSVSELEI